MTGDLGRQIRAKREALGLSQEALAERAGTSQSTIDRVERGGKSTVMLACVPARSKRHASTGVSDVELFYPPVGSMS